MPFDVGSLHYAVGPVVALVVLGLLAVFMRWAFGTGGTSSRRRPARGSGPGAVDDGLLTRVATCPRREAALALRAILSDAGIRSTVRPAPQERAVVLVFPEDADRARALASSFPAGD